MAFDGSAIKKIADEKGMSMYALAKATGLSQTAIRKIFNNKINKTPRDSTFIALASALGVSPDVLGMSYPNSKRLELSGGVGAAAPLIGIYSPCDLANRVLGRNVPEPKEFIHCPFQCTDSDLAIETSESSDPECDPIDLDFQEVLGLRVCGNSMAPEFKDGDVVFIQTSELADICISEPPANGSCCVCILGQGNEVYAAPRFIETDEKGNGTYWAKALNGAADAGCKNPQIIGTFLGVIRSGKNSVK